MTNAQIQQLLFWLADNVDFVFWRPYLILVLAVVALASTYFALSSLGEAS